MKTNDLIVALSSGLSPTPKGVLARNIFAVIALSIPLVSALSVALLGMRSDFSHFHIPLLALLKMSFGLSVAIIGGIVLVKLAAPGKDASSYSVIVLAPFVIILGLAVSTLTFAISASVHDLVDGTSWLSCILSIPVIAVLPFAMMTYVLRRYAAPTNLAKTGAVAGLTSGGLGAVGYSIYCPDDSIVFIAGWYVIAIAATTLVGGLLGPRLLRW